MKCFPIFWIELLKMKIYHKDVWGFWIFARYSFFLEDESEGLVEVTVDKNTWVRYNVGDIYEIS